jgi:hypothetical protein
MLNINQKRYFASDLGPLLLRINQIINLIC